MENYDFFEIFENRKTNNKILSKIILELPFETLTKYETEDIAKIILSTKDKTTTNIKNLLS